MSLRVRLAFLVVALRWVALGGGLALAAATSRSLVVVLAGAVLVALAAWLTTAPTGPRPDPDRTGRWRPGPGTELVVVATMVVITGGWASAFAPMLAVPVLAGGLMSGLTPALTLAGAGAGGVTIASLGLVTVGLGSGARWWPGAGGVLELVLLALLAAHSRHLARAAEVSTNDAAGRLERLQRANHLLAELHQMARDLPGSLAVPQVVATTMTRLRELVAPDRAVLLLAGQPGATSQRWTVASSYGLRLAPVVDGADLPDALREAGGGGLEVDLDVDCERAGLSPSSGRAVYVALVAGGRRLGLLAVEWDRARGGHGDPVPVPGREHELVSTVAQQAAVALDNARLFSALRCSGAEEERHRIARNLHDDVGQELACLALTLDQIWLGLGRGEEDKARSQVDGLRQEARRLIGHVRETMADLRTDVTPERDLAGTLEGFATRVKSRSGVTVAVDAGGGRLPLAQEREMWRIAQEAITNAERHARAERIDVHWWPGPGPALLEVRDDGIGLHRGGLARPDGGGLVAMGERAAALGAALDVEDQAKGGTVVRCQLS